MRLIDPEDAIRGIVIESVSDNDEAIKATAKAIVVIQNTPTIVEFEGDINKVIVKGEEYHKQLTTMWLNPYSPYTCEHCGFHVDSKTRYCPECGRRASNYEV